MSENSFLIPECYVDTCLAEVLLQAGKKHVNHQKGNGTVAGKMKDWFGDAFCVGMIDEDRKPLDYLKEFDLKVSQGNLKLWKHRTKHHYMIQLCPVIEVWIINECAVREIPLAGFGLPTELRSLLKVTKSIGVEADDRFVQLFKEMVRLQCESVIRLKNWIEYLKQEKYKADINKLING